MTVSVIIPSYNPDADILATTVASIVNQSSRVNEIIIVDDCSPDEKSDSIYEEIHKKHNDASIRILQLDKNSGSPIARNIGAQAAKSDWIAFCDEDDYWLPEKLKRQFFAINKHALDVSLTGGYNIDEHGMRISSEWTELRTEDEMKKALFLRNFQHVNSNIVIRKDLFEQIGGFDAAMVRCHDYELLFRLIDAKARMHSIPDELVVYRVHNKSTTMTQNIELVEQHYSKYFEKILSVSPELELFTNAYWAKTYNIIGTYYRRYDDLKRSREYFWKSIRTKISVKSVLNIILTLSSNQIFNYFAHRKWRYRTH
ncbi:MAG: glycosyltransferase [Candidatus Marinimicrobia bacterium]|nr:glycosyltransferase [Candidatus Neomarinimicrobiota bacterium]MCF7850188.1 glycosyltransferase [Candidatus Neomarinimicrobiota bacterium]